MVMDIWHNGVKISADCENIDGTLCVEIGNETVEVFKCPKCGKYKTKYDFYKNNTNKDGHSSWCKECTLEYHKERRTQTKETPSPIKETEKPEMDAATLLGMFKDALESVLNNKKSEEQLSELYDRIEELEMENKSLKESNEKMSKELIMNRLDKRTVEEWIKTHPKELDSRIAANCLRSTSPQYTLVLVDTVSGATKEYAYDVA